ncbi:hypothetical protein [Fibrella arboris]|uniref:hypothetical protein n=1 Tax=Fibrella arboris TaxID=3242486 RepID=UPI0035204258
MSLTIEELDESLFWLEMLIFAELVAANRLDELLDEGKQRLKVLSKARSSTKQNKIQTFTQSLIY